MKINFFKIVSGIILVLFSATENGFSQWSYQTIPSHFLAGYDITATERSTVLAGESTWYDLTTSLPSGYVTDGSVDYTTYLQGGINTHSNVKMPDFPVRVRGLSIKNRSDVKVYFPANSSLIEMPSSTALAYEIFYLENDINCSIYFANLIGYKVDSIPGNGIRLANCYNTNIVAPRVVDCSSDGIYIRNLNTGTGKTQISKAILDNNSRDGITLISDSALTINKLIAANTNGSNGNGIHIECSYKGVDTSARYDSIKINDMTSFNNSGKGVMLWLDYYHVNKIRPFKNVSMKFTNFIDSISDQSIRLVATKHNCAAAYITRIKGYVTFVNPKFYLPKSGTYLTIEDDCDKNDAIFTFDWDCSYNNDNMFTKAQTDIYDYYSFDVPNWINLKVRTSSYGLNCSGNLCLGIPGCGSGLFPLSKTIGLDLDTEVYPNPADNILNIRSRYNALDYTIRSADGRVLQHNKIAGCCGRIDISGYPSGLYLIEITNDQEVSRHKFIKQ